MIDHFRLPLPCPSRLSLSGSLRSISTMILSHVLSNLTDFTSDRKAGTACPPSIPHRMPDFPGRPPTWVLFAAQAIPDPMGMSWSPCRPRPAHGVGRGAICDAASP
ncbi:MAG: hypothetical protein OXD45_10305 [Rhodobacteraceae bacterium]|nr:hypothetical protein [Paracoccaceae bacterium]